MLKKCMLKSCDFQNVLITMNPCCTIASCMPITIVSRLYNMNFVEIPHFTIPTLNSTYTENSAQIMKIESDDCNMFLCPKSSKSFFYIPELTGSEYKQGKNKVILVSILEYPQSKQEKWCKLRQALWLAYKSLVMWMEGCDWTSVTDKQFKQVLEWRRFTRASPENGSRLLLSF